MDYLIYRDHINRDYLKNGFDWKNIDLFKKMQIYIYIYIYIYIANFIELKMNS